MESDLSAFHRIDDPMRLTGPRLIRLATRLPAYQGAVAARLAAIRMAEQDLTDNIDTPPAPPPPTRPSGSNNGSASGGRAGGAAKRNPDAPDLLLPGPQVPGAEVIPAEPAILALSEMGHLFSFGNG